MKNLLSFVITASFALSLPATLLQGRAAAQETGWTGNANLFLGSKALNKNEWEPANDQAEIGVEVDFRKRDWPVSIAIDFLGAYGEGKVYDPFFGEVRLESETDELSVGIRKVWDSAPHARPFIEGGLSLVKATGRVSMFGATIEDSGNGSGYWLGGGIYWTLGEAFNIGLELRASSAKANIFGQDLKVGGGHAGLLLGYHWGGSAGNGETYKPAAPERGLRPGTSYDGHESEKLDLERQKLEVEKQRLEVERQKLDLEKQKFELKKGGSGQD